MSSDSEILSSRQVLFAGDDSGNERFFRLKCETVKENGEVSDRYIWERGSFIVIVARDERGRFIYIREFKHAARKLLFCLPAGGVKKNETPEEAALRELFEETGYVGTLENCSKLGPFFNSPDKSTETHFVIIVENAKREGAPAPEITEVIFGVQLASLETGKEHLEVALHLMAIYKAADYLEARNSHAGSKQRAA